MSKIPIFNIFYLIVSICILLNIDAILDWNYRIIFHTYILPKLPNARFENFFHENRVKTDKNFMFQIWMIVLVINAFLIYLHFRLLKIKQVQYPDKRQLFRFFFLRFMAYIFIFSFLPLNFAIIGRNSISPTTISDSDIIAFSTLILVVINIFSLIPYLAQKEINVFIKFKDVVVFNVGMLILFSVLLYFKVNPYICTSISSGFFSFAFSQKIKIAWNNIEIFFDIKGKKIYEMF